MDGDKTQRNTLKLVREPSTRPKNWEWWFLLRFFTSYTSILVIFLLIGLRLWENPYY